MIRSMAGTYITQLLTFTFAYIFQSPSVFVLFFFFQAEAGIRDLYVTGVQTCALPIFRGRCWSMRSPASPANSYFALPRVNSKKVMCCIGGTSRPAAECAPVFLTICFGCLM